jgi:hypothetical protein
MRECVNVKCSCSAPLSDKMSAARRELSCFLRSLSGAHPDIQLKNGEEVALGRSKLTGIKDGKCSRNQLMLTADYSAYRVRQGGEDVSTSQCRKACNIKYSRVRNV